VESPGDTLSNHKFPVCHLCVDSSPGRQSEGQGKMQMNDAPSPELMKIIIGAAAGQGE